ncbi:MAG: FkbM family methyltransferase [Cytophagales bacterium]|nr:FkbM family methyltransferase [Bernardetiaceae bacterium]MDW8211007.1 FkbM family methyltransferase [Cytophagales bacterium]
MISKLLYKVFHLFSEVLFQAMAKVDNQQFWEKVFELALRKMNFGEGGNIYQSGELWVLQFISQQLSNQKQIVIFDVGANKGEYTLTLTEFFKGNATIYAFEPSPKAFQYLSNNLKGLDNVVLENLGFSDCKQVKPLFSNEIGSGLASLYQRRLQHFGIQMEFVEQVSLSTVDSYCKENNIEHIHFLKLDVEGHEIAVLKGAENMLSSKKIDFIQFEFGGCNIDSRTFFQDFFYLLKDSYQIYRILKNSLYPISFYKETYEIFVTTNYLAVKR